VQVENNHLGKTHGKWSYIKTILTMRIEMKSYNDLPPTKQPKIHLHNLQDF